jgi:hypothetical protein
MLNWFFNKNGDQKKWFVLFSVFVPLVIGVFFGIWGIRLTIQSNDNREDIEALTQMTLELKKQNDLLQKSVAIQDSQFKTYTDEVKYSKQPRFKAELWGGEPGEPADIDIKITNLGAGISDVTLIPLNGAKITSKGSAKKKVVASGSSFIIRLSNLRTGVGLRITFTDALMNKYSQDLSWASDGETLDFGMIKELKKQ